MLRLLFQSQFCLLLLSYILFTPLLKLILWNSSNSQILCNFFCKILSGNLKSLSNRIYAASCSYNITHILYIQFKSINLLHRALLFLGLKILIDSPVFEKKLPIETTSQFHSGQSTLTTPSNHILLRGSCEKTWNFNIFRHIFT